MLKVLTIGAGAVGSYVGGYLALAGNEVVFFDREQTAKRLRSQGLRLISPTSEQLIKHPIIETDLQHALAHGPYDVAFFAVKSYHTEAVLSIFEPLASDLPPIICLQNGVENEMTLAKTLGQDMVIAGTVTSSVRRDGRGSMVLERRRGVGLAVDHPDVNRFAAAMKVAGLNVRLYPNALAMKWSKLVTNLIANATSAILDLSPAEIFANPGLFQLEIGQLRETLRVMKALNLPVVNLPGTPVRLLAFAVLRLPAKITQPILSRAVGGGRGGKMPSFHMDYHAGHGMSEVGYLNGAVVRFGDQRGVPTPINRQLTKILTSLTSGELDPNPYAHKPANLLREFNLAQLDPPRT